MPENVYQEYILIKSKRVYQECNHSKPPEKCANPLKSVSGITKNVRSENGLASRDRRFMKLRFARRSLNSGEPSGGWHPQTQRTELLTGAAHGPPLKVLWTSGGVVPPERKKNSGTPNSELVLRCRGVIPSAV